MADFVATPIQRPGLNALAQLLRMAREQANEISLPNLLDMFASPEDKPRRVQPKAGSAVLGRAPEAMERIAYGDLPITVPQGTRIPVTKTGRKEDIAELVNLATVFPSPLRKTAAALAAGAEVPAVAAVIKPKGGNWPVNRVERMLSDLKRSEPYALPMNEAEAAAYRAQGFTRQDPNTEGMLVKPDSVNDWIDKQLTRYFKNEMATPQDLVRALAERGVLHVDPQSLIHGRREIHSTGDVLEKLAQSEAAKAWENSADRAIYSQTAGDLAQRRQGSLHSANPWLKKVSPETLVYSPSESATDLGFGHLIDELRNATNPQSGLPRELLWKYTDLPKVSVPQAVQRVHDINQWRAAQKILADAQKAQNPATFVHKEYPEAGFSWVELRQPEANLPEGYTIDRRSGDGLFAVSDPSGKPVSYGATEAEAIRLLNRKEREAALEEALKYEGDTMGHCVGGYCPDVLEGRSRIFSLRDKKGEPHVTVEVAPIKRNSKAETDWFTSQPEHIQDEITTEALAAHDAAKTNQTPAQDRRTWGLVLGDAIRKRMGDIPPEIIQIKGKANRAPNPEYLPFIQDFVRSGKWSDVGDLQNTGLRYTRDILNPKELEALKQRGHTFDEYMTEKERAGLQKLWDEGKSD